MKLSDLKKLIPWQELDIVESVRELQKAAQAMADHIGNIPALYETDGDGNAQCVLHYFDTRGSADWYIFEVDPGTGEAFGFTTLSGDFTDPNAEWGYIWLPELTKRARINLDLHFNGITKAEIRNKQRAA